MLRIEYRVLNTEYLDHAQSLHVCKLLRRSSSSCGSFWLFVTISLNCPECSRVKGQRKSHSGTSEITRAPLRVLVTLQVVETVKSIVMGDMLQVHPPRCRIDCLQN